MHFFPVKALLSLFLVSIDTILPLPAALSFFLVSKETAGLLLPDFLILYLVLIDTGSLLAPVAPSPPSVRLYPFGAFVLYLCMYFISILFSFFLLSLVHITLHSNESIPYLRIAQ